MEKGERCNKLFFYLQQRNNYKKNIQRLKKNNKNILTTPEEIMNEIEKYYTEMFTGEDQEGCREDIFFPYNHVKLTDDQKQSCEGLIKEDELYSSLASQLATSWLLPVRATAVSCLGPACSAID